MGSCTKMTAVETLYQRVEKLEELTTIYRLLIPDLTNKNSFKNLLPKSKKSNKKVYLQIPMVSKVMTHFILKNWPKI